VLALQALVQQAQGETDEAVGTLGRALTLAEPEGYVRLFVDEGRPMGELLARIVVGKTAVSDYAARLLTAFETEPMSDEARPAQKVTETAVTPEVDIAQADIAHWLAEPLSERELEALQLVAEGLTNRQVGERLYISTATVKKHMENIYGKLYVRNRTQAVARARELGLL
jgi:LuxR family transcriptional regulator, maltose regulon positive regulatory protein